MTVVRKGEYLRYICMYIPIYVPRSSGVYILKSRRHCWYVLCTVRGQVYLPAQYDRLPISDIYTYIYSVRSTAATVGRSKRLHFLTAFRTKSGLPNYVCTYSVP